MVKSQFFGPIWPFLSILDLIKPREDHLKIFFFEKKLLYMGKYAIVPNLGTQRKKNKIRSQKCYRLITVLLNSDINLFGENMQH